MHTHYLTFVHLCAYPSRRSIAQILDQSYNKEDSYTAKQQVGMHIHTYIRSVSQFTCIHST